jgi:hypothetical protein
MSLENIAYWGAFVIPLVLLGLSAFIQKIIDGGPGFKREHFYIGIDLTVYFMASIMVNFLDIAKTVPVNAMGIVWTVLFLTAGLVMLFIQIGLYQSWKPRDGKTQFVMLGLFSNLLGILLLYGFVQLKARGLL